ncbi:MAG: pilus assembly protein PilM [Desulfobacterales bacterium]|nr:pilus assembly protein PilM [Desulfobacterales bacterium]
MQTRKIVGIDIRKEQIASVSVSKTRRGVRIEDVKLIPVDSEKGIDIIEHKDIFSNALTQIIEHIDIRLSQFMVSLPSQGIIYRNLILPFLDKKKIKQILPFELESYIARPVENIKIQFQIFPMYSDSEKQHSNATGIFACSVDGDWLKKYEDILNEYHIHPEMITVAGLPHASLLSHWMDKNEQMIFIQMDQLFCTVFGLINKQIRIARSFLMSSPQLDINSLGMEIQRSIDWIEDQLDVDLHFDKVMVSGFNQDFIDKNQYFLTDMLGMPVQSVDWTNNCPVPITFNETIDPLLFQNEGLNHALALALVETERIDMIHFVERVFASQKFFHQYKFHMIRSCVILFFTLLSFAMYAMVDYYILQNKVTHIDQTIKRVFKETFPDVARIVDPVQQMKLNIDAYKKTLLVQDHEKQILCIDILNAISQQIASGIDVQLTRLVISPEGVVLTGDTSSFNYVDEMKNQLEKSKKFTKVTIDSATIQQGGTRVVFKLQIKL